MRGTTQKLKLLYLKEIFEEETDNEHAISMPKIVEELEKHGVPAERKSIYDDIRLLQEEYSQIYHQQLDDRENDVLTHKRPNHKSVTGF